ncbi:MAG: branched-chain amino acid transport system II carrier protein [Peptostreptococcaceae bacterium]|jgi:LIVCS family branched-chain amino acid:cation transporter|nr:branched-chain amino acid transport system II carrier protein [Peptostreptococcaceae bacterium]
MTKKKNTDFIVIGLALFAMFFGAGNLIFPPSIGINSGGKFSFAMLGFFITGIGIPLLGVLSLSKAGGTVYKFANKGGNIFGKLFGIIVVLSIGPLLAIPRTAATTYEMGIVPVFGTISPLLVSVIYFGITLALVIKPSAIVDNIGKILTPVILIILALIIFKGISTPIGPLNPNVDISNAFSEGFLGGYQTMDALGAIVLGVIAINAVKDKGYTDEGIQRKMILKSSLIAASGLAIVYGGLLYLGATLSQTLPLDTPKTELMIYIAHTLLGNVGTYCLSICVSFACLTTSVGLTATVGDYFYNLSNKKIKYEYIVIATALFSTIMSVGGVEKIVKISVPLLVLIYPLSIVLILLNLVSDKINGKLPYQGALIGAFIVSLNDCFGAMGVQIDAFNKVTSALPLAKQGFGWLVPSLIGFFVCLLISKNNSTKDQLKKVS